MIQADEKPGSVQVLWVISMAAFLWLHLSSDRTASLLGCTVVIVFAAVCMFKTKIFRDPAFLPRPAYMGCSLLICSALSYNFYRAWMKSKKIIGIAAFAGCTNKQLVLPFSIICAILAGKAFVFLTGIYLVGISAILRANFNYIDDTGRVAEGYRNWRGFSRFLSDGLSVLIHTDSHITDISPLTQMTAVVLVALAGMVLIYVVYERKVYTVWEVLALVSLGLNPYFLECLSYKFDAPFMAISILAGVVPLLYREKETWEYILAAAIGTIVVCTSYQAATGVFPMCVVLLAVRMWMKRLPCKQILAFCFKSVSGFAVGMIFYKTVIMIPIDVHASYASNAMPPFAEIIPTMLMNYKGYLGMLLSDLKSIWKWMLLLLCACFVISGLAFSRQKKSLTFLIASLSGIIMFLCCFGLYPALEKPIFEPRAMYGFGVFVTLLSVNVAECRQKEVLRMPALAIAWMFFVFSLTYGNALYIQKTYTDFRIAQVITDLNDMDVFLGETPVVVQIAGTIGRSPVVSSMGEGYNILNRPPVTMV